MKLVGQKTNRSAIGARIKVVTAGANPQTVYRWVSSGSSFGANPLEQRIGLSKADRILRAGGVLAHERPTAQVFRGRPHPANQGIRVTEFAQRYRKRKYKPIPVPK